MNSVVKTLEAASFLIRSVRQNVENAAQTVPKNETTFGLAFDIQVVAKLQEFHVLLQLIEGDALLWRVEAYSARLHVYH